MMHVYKWFIQVRGCWYTSLMACKKQKKGNLVVAEREKDDVFGCSLGREGEDTKEKEPHRKSTISRATSFICT